MRKPIIGVVGGGSRHVADDSPIFRRAFDVGRAIAANDAIVLCGGGGGVMRAAALGARASGGHSIGILPHASATDAEYALATEMGDGRNYVNAYVSDVLIALFGEAGTLSEIALAMKIGRPVVYLGHWGFLNDAGLPPMPFAQTADEAVAQAFACLGVRPGDRMSASVSVPTITDQTARLADLAQWVEGLG